MNEDQNIAKLPPEIIVHISRYLNIQDKFKLRLINKEFKATFDYLIKLDQLIIDYSTDFNKNWFYTNRRKKEIDLIGYNVNNILDDLFKKNLFLNLKKLSFHHYRSTNFEIINQLKYLEELNIHFNIESNSILSLSKLKILSIEQSQYSKCTIELETPLLSIMRCENLEYYQFNYPEKIIYFDTELMFYDCQLINLNNRIQLFKNLQYLILYFKSAIELKSILITKLNHLKELHLNQYYINHKNLIKIQKIYDLKLKLKLNNLRIFIYGIDYENLKELNRYQLSNQSDLIFKNYSNTIDIIPFVDTIEFDKLFKFLNSNPNVSLDNVIYKFPNIRCIYAYKLDDIDCFFQFLSKYDNLKILHLKLIKNQIYYLDKLADLCKRIEYLYLHNLNVDESTNLDFLFKFKKLYHLGLGELDDMNIVRNLSHNFNISIDCKFIYKKYSFKINYRYHYWYNNREFDSSSELFDHFDYVIDHSSNEFSYFNSSNESSYFDESGDSSD